MNKGIMNFGIWHQQNPGYESRTSHGFLQLWYRGCALWLTKCTPINIKENRNTADPLT